MSRTFIDPSGDTLKVENYSGPAATGFITVRQAGRGVGWELRKDDRLPLAAQILKPLDATILEGPLPDVRVDDHMGTKRLTAGNATVEVSEAEKDYCLSQARKYLSLAGAIDRVQAKDEEERQTRLAALAKLNKRRNELAAQFSNLPSIEYRDVASSALRRAIDRVIEMESAK